MEGPAASHGQMIAQPAHAMQLTHVEKDGTRQLGADHAKCVGGRAVACSFVAHHQVDGRQAGVLSPRGRPLSLAWFWLRWHVMSS